MKKKYVINGLDCPNCAKKIEKFLIKSGNFHKVSIDFINHTLFIEGNEKFLNEEYISGQIAKVEDGIEIKEEEKRKTSEKILNKKAIIALVRILISTILVVVTKIFENEIGGIFTIILYLLSYIIVSYDIFYKVFKNIFVKHIFFDENTLMFIATIGAIALQDYFEAVLVMILNQVGELLQHISISKSKRAIVGTIDLRADTANLVIDDVVKEVSPDDLCVDDIVLLKAGDNVPADGTIIDGIGSLDTSSLTGESLPLEVEKGGSILSGMYVYEGTLKMRVDKVAYESTASKVMELVTSSSQNKSKAEHFITKFATFYTPIVFFIALIIGIVPPLFNGEWANYLHRALSFLVISCPCAIIISIPLSYFVAMGMSAKNGIIVKGGNYLDLINEVDQVVFDKTGTVTYGNFVVSEYVPSGISIEEFKMYFYALESNSNHLIARAIKEAFSSNYDYQIADIQEVAGKGMSAVVNGNKIMVGNEKMMENVIDFTAINSNKTTIYISKNSIFAGYVVVSDEIKPSSIEFINYLKKNHIKTMMLTGDRKENAEEICKNLGIDNYHSNCLPVDKVSLLEEDMKNARKTMYIGDGINDAPSIARADLGVAMGIKGADIAVENADVIIMNDDLISVKKIFKIAKLTRKQAIFNIIFALIVKLAVLLIAAFDINLGISNMIIAVIADVGLSLFLVMLTMLMGKRKIK